MLTLAAGTKMTCADAAKKLLKDNRKREVRSAGKGSKGERWYAWAWLGTASPRRSLLVRRHLKTGELAFHYCFVPEGQSALLADLLGRIVEVLSSDDHKPGCTRLISRA